MMMHERQRQERDPFNDLRRLLQSLDLNLTGMLQNFRLNHIKRMTWGETFKDRIPAILFLNYVKERGLMHPFWSKVLSWCINFAAKVFCECTHFEEKFPMDIPILKKSFLWMHPFWRKVFFWCTHFECTRKIRKQSGQIEQQQQQQQQHFPLHDLSAAPQIKRGENSGKANFVFFSLSRVGGRGRPRAALGNSHYQNRGEKTVWLKAKKGFLSFFRMQETI